MLHGTFYLKSKSEPVTNKNDVNDLFKSVYSTVISKI